MSPKPTNYLDIFRENGLLTARIRDKLVTFAQTHSNLADIDNLANQLIKEAGGEPAFQRVPGYKWATCISLNDAIVHGIPKGHTKPGDLVTIDTGMYYQGTTTDTAATIVIGEPTPAQQKFLHTGEKALYKAISQAKPGNTIKHISQALQTTIEKAGFSVSRTLTGHGLGDSMHQDPAIPCFVSTDPVLNTKLKPGMVLAVEIMYMRGNWPLSLAQDGWTLSTKDGSDSAVFEHDIIITQEGPEVITSSV